MKKGFTLIELLVVVLIIGILAAIAVPQYQKAVEISKAKPILAIMKSIKQAEDAYYLTNNEYTLDFTKLDITLPYSYISENKSEIITADGHYYLNCDGSYCHVTAYDKAWNWAIYSALPKEVWLCYQYSQRGKEVCRMLGCEESTLNNQYCSFIPK